LDPTTTRRSRWYIVAVLGTIIAIFVVAIVITGYLTFAISGPPPTSLRLSTRATTMP
jgi:hypothetical protein